MRTLEQTKTSRNWTALVSKKKGMALGEFPILMVLPESRLYWLVCSLPGLRNQREFRTTTPAAE